MTALRLDRLPDEAPDGDTSDWSVHIVLRDGSIVTREVASFHRAAGCVLLSSDLDPVPLTGAKCVLESASAPSTQWRVLSVRETDGPGLEFCARQYDPGRYAAVETGLKLDTQALDAGPGSRPAPASVSLHERLYEDGGVTRSALAVGVEDPLGARGARVAAIDAQIRRTSGADTGYRPLAFGESGLVEVPEVRPGATYQARARYIGRSGAVRGPWTESDEVTVAGFDELAEPAGVSVTAVGGGYAVAWDALSERDYAYTEILERTGSAVAEVVGRSAASPWPRLGLQATERHVSVRHVDRTGRRTAASAESAVTPEPTDAGAAEAAAARARASATAAADSAAEADRTVAGMPAAVATEVDSHLDTAFADAVVLREKTGAAQRLELAGLADLGGDADTAQIDAGALRAGDEFEVSADGRLGIADAAHPVVPLWAGSVEVPADGAVVSLPLSADLRPFGVIRGSAIAGVSPYAAVRVAMIVPGAVAGTASARPVTARKFAAVLNATASAEVYYWRSADGETLHLQNDTAAGTPLAVRLLSLVGVRNSDVLMPPAPVQATPPPLPSAVAPTVRIAAVDSVNEGQTQTLTASVSGGTYDGDPDYSWEVVPADGGTISGSGRSVTYRAPSVTADTVVQVRATVTVQGNDITAASGTEDDSDDTETFTVIDVPTLTEPGLPGPPRRSGRTGRSLSMTCDAPTTGGAPSRYRWRYSTDSDVSDSDPQVTSTGPAVMIACLSHPSDTGRPRRACRRCRRRDR